MTDTDWHLRHHKRSSPVKLFSGDTPAAAAATAAAQRHEGQDRVGEEEAEDEAEEVRVVVHPRQESGEEEDGRHADHLEERHLGVLETRPLVDHFHHAARQEPEVAAGRTHLNYKEDHHSSLILLLHL